MLAKMLVGTLARLDYASMEGLTKALTTTALSIIIMITI
jgi:hypothetical protein